MKVSALLAALPAVAVAYTQQDYESGAVHDKLMAMKNAQWDADAARGEQDSSRFASWADVGVATRPGKSDGYVRCRNGLAIAEEGNKNQTFRCKNMDLYDFKSHADLGSVGQGSSSWGWIDPRSRREFGAIGQYDGTAFVEIKRNGQLSYLGRLPKQDPIGSRWRELRVLGDKLIIGSEAVAHGVVIFDMKKLLNLDPKNPKTFSTLPIVGDVTGVYNGLPIGRAHNIVINQELNYAMAVGAQPRNETCKSGMQFLDLRDPSNPTSPGCASGDGYVHDAQSIKYNGPDRRYKGKDITIGFNEDTVTVYETTSKTGNPASRIISKANYTGASYTHQGVFLNDRHEYMLVDDELDEVDKKGPSADGIPKTFIFDMRDLENIKQVGFFNATGNTPAIDHNQYMHEGLVYQSNYGAGLWVHDVTSIPRDPSGKSVENVAFFDIYPEDDEMPGGGAPAFHGTWSHFHFGAEDGLQGKTAGRGSGYTLVNTIERGVFVVKNTGRTRGRFPF